MKNKILKSNKGFTLAEVLVTLAIIGVVAALTIPSLMNSYQENVWKNSFKKNYADLVQATNLIMADNDGAMINACEGGCSSNAIILLNQMKDEYKKHLKYVKECNLNASLDVCWPTTIKCLNNICSSNTYGGSPALVLMSGASVNIYYYYSACDRYYNNESCGFIEFDINGLKPPNQWGKDVFRTHLTRYGLNAAIDSSWGCDPLSATNTGYGKGCGAYVLSGRDY